MIKYILIMIIGFIAVAFLYSLIVRFKWFFITLGLLLASAAITHFIIKFRKNVELCTVAEEKQGLGNKPTSKPGEISTTSASVVPALKGINLAPEIEVSAEVATEPTERIDPAVTEFEAALQAIQRVDIPLSDPVSRHLLRDLPEYSFSNITRKTRLDSIFPLVFLDIETTGFAPSKCEIVEVAAIKFDSGMIPVAAFTTLCKPKKPIPEEASAVNHITDEMVADAPAFSQIAPALTNFLKGCHMAGHNLDFDLRFIFAHGADLPDGVRFYDTLDLSHLTIPSSSVFNYKLDTVCRYYGIRRSDSHRALSDCYATSKLFSHLVFDKTSRQLDAEAEILSELSAE